MCSEQNLNLNNKTLCTFQLQGGETERNICKGPMTNVSPPGHTLKLLHGHERSFDFNIVCLRGYLEVVTLRRLDEHHNANAIDLLYTSDGNVSIALHFGIITSNARRHLLVSFVLFSTLFCWIVAYK